jgi:3-isopropylmalate dehydrogenase
VKAQIAVLAGDGVGREIVPEAIKLLKAVGERFHHTFEFMTGDVGGHAIDKVGVPLPKSTLALAKQSDAVLLGAVGGPRWEGLDYTLRPERALLGLREELGLFANLRPANPRASKRRSPVKKASTPRCTPQRKSGGLRKSPSRRPVSESAV